MLNREFDVRRAENKLKSNMPIEKIPDIKIDIFAEGGAWGKYFIGVSQYALYFFVILHSICDR